MTTDHSDTRDPARTGARRADAGSVRVSVRDIELLRIVGEQYAVTLPQLALMMGRSEHAARWLRSRWERAGWAKGRAVLVDAPVFVWLTRRGSSLAGLDYSVWRPNAGMLAHIGAVTDVRLHVLDRHPRATWVCERELHRELAATNGRVQGHRPDGLVVIDGRELAVEVELTLKRRARIEQIMAELVARYGSVTYFAAPAVRRTLTAVAADIGRDRVQVLPLPKENP